MNTPDKVTNAWQEYRHQLLGYILPRVKNEQDAEDILGMAFTRLISHSHEQGLPDDILHWLYRVVKNAIIDYYRGKKDFVDLPESEAEDEQPPNALEKLSACVRPMIALLAEPYRSTLMLSDIQQMDNRTVAHTIGKTLTATKAEIRRAREQLKTVVADCCRLKTNNAQTQTLDAEPQVTACCKKCDP